MVVVGGVVPPQDYEALKAAGAEAIFPPGTVIADAARDLWPRSASAWDMRRRRRSKGRGAVPGAPRSPLPPAGEGWEGARRTLYAQAAETAQ